MFGGCHSSKKAGAFLLLVVAASQHVAAQNSLDIGNQHFRVSISKSTGAVVRFERAGDPNSPNFVMSPDEYPEFSVPDSRWFGDIVLRYRIGDGTWKHASTAGSGSIRHVSRSDGARVERVVVEYSGNTGDRDAISDLKLKESYELSGDSFNWSITLENQTARPIEIGDLGLPLLFDTFYAKDPITTYTKRVIRHSYIEGDDSYIFWMRPDGNGPFLLMTPAAGTHLEYYNAHSQGDGADAPDPVFARRGAWEGLYTVYIHAKEQAEEYDRGGSWRQPLTSKILNPAGKAGSEVTYQFVFHWESDYEAIRDELFHDGLIDIEVAPGMVTPTDLDAHFSLKTRQRIASVESEFPSETTLQAAPSADSTRSTYTVRFQHLGENRITIGYGDGLRTQLEYFVTEPIEVLIKKRAAFLVRNQQIRDKSKWYDGEFVPWDMETYSVRTPDNIGDLDPFMTGGSDDPSLCKAPYIAAKNLLYPQAAEVEAVEYYIRNFVWGKLQRTDSESPFPFGIYGTPNWYQLRNSATGLDSGGNGREHMWRTFDYTHLIQLYFEMYRVAKLYPQLVHYASADEYLERAYGTAKAFFEVPYQIKMGAPWAFRGWTDWAFKQGNFHEVFIPDLINALEAENHHQEAQLLRTDWEKKVLYFLYDHPYPFGSEMYFDTTAFESTHAIADYAADHNFDPREAAWVDKNTDQRYEHSDVKADDVQRFMRNEIRANIAARGNLESNYYQLGSDIRQGGDSNYLLSYMTQMGGWSILDYALQDPNSRIDFLRLGYASYLAGWADMNSGTPSSKYGFWFPGKEDDGAAGWGFNPQKVGFTWIRHVPEIHRGIWPYDGEIDSGFSGSFRAASVVVVNDPLFGLMAYGGEVRREGDVYKIVCRDGVEQRLSIFTLEHPIQIVLDANHFSSNQPVTLTADGSEISIPTEVTDPKPQSSELTVTGLPAGNYELLVDGKRAQRIHVSSAGRLDAILEFESTSLHQVNIRRVVEESSPNHS